MIRHGTFETSNIASYWLLGRFCFAVIYVYRQFAIKKTVNTDKVFTYIELNKKEH